MKTIFWSLSLLVTGITGTAHSIPKMWVKEASGRVPLSIDSLQADITITGSLVETVYTLRFRNKTNRMQEGEFVLPLPEGATISNYALEVNGALRPAVAVEKKQARHAYESIKRQMIDPGLVEREQGNTYRTRVFPIPANGTKLIRIGYIEQLSQDNGNISYQLPTDYPGTIEQITYRIHHPENRPPTVTPGELDFSYSSSRLLSAKASQKKLTQPLELSWQQPASNTLVSDSQDGFTSHHLTFNVPTGLNEKPRSHPRHVHIIWDTSASCQDRDPAPELALLGAYFHHLQNTRVTLQLMRNQLVPAGEYTIKDGDWSTLHNRLKELSYDGATSFHSIFRSQPVADVTIIVTDGKNSQHIATRVNQCTHILHRSSGQHLTRATVHSHGSSINLTQTTHKDALRMLTHSRPLLTGVIHGGNQSPLPPPARHAWEHHIRHLSKPSHKSRDREPAH